MKKKLSSGSSEIPKNEENAFLYLGRRVYKLLIINLSRKKSSFVFDLITWWSTIESQLFLLPTLGIQKFQCYEKENKLKTKDFIFFN